MQNSEGMTPLMIARSKGGEKIAEALLAAGAMTHFVSAQPMRASHCADKNGHTQLGGAVRLMEDTSMHDDEWSEEVKKKEHEHDEEDHDEEDHDEEHGEEGFLRTASSEAAAEPSRAQSGELEGGVSVSVENLGGSERITSAGGGSLAVLETLISTTGTAKQAAKIKNRLKGTQSAKARLAAERKAADAASLAAEEAQARFEWLEKVSFFPLLDEKRMKQLCGRMVTHRLVEREVVKRGKDSQQAMFVVCSGEVRCLLQRMVGRRMEMVEMNLSVGESFGEASLLTGDPVDVTFTAFGGGVELVELTKGDFQGFIDQNWKIVPGLSGFLAHSIAYAMHTVGVEVRSSPPPKDAPSLQ